MIERFCQVISLVIIFSSPTLVGCNSRPTAIEPVEIDADQAGELAIEMHDKDGDGALSSSELQAVPGILNHLEKYDLDEDGMVSSQEITERIELWNDQAMGIRTLDVEVSMDNRPLSGASVRFVPETFLGDGPKPASGMTDSKGFAKISVAVDELPEDLRKARMRGIYGGTYKIEITHPSMNIPSKFNTATTLGEEVARDTIGDWLVLKLQKD
ncbi:hypothetical protein [Bythopirellula polymerisocia]|uniref:EF-hand domain-containing protein n=1 Tax=Bythopirellula polymerisocia TaxID=2528003 RepID=A0A5C6CFI8_9BACT|nr:hypothetical protein [Bythopirellula polymerisocia]TWU22795.1 hypothetical protein Pla144_42560 [Bythopirellula polymerisocia]